MVEKGFKCNSCGYIDLQCKHIFIFFGVYSIYPFKDGFCSKCGDDITPCKVKKCENGDVVEVIKGSNLSGVDDGVSIKRSTFSESI